MEKFYTGQSIPMIDKDTYQHYYPKPTPATPKGPGGPKTLRAQAASKNSKGRGTNKSKQPAETGLENLPQPTFSVIESYNLPDMVDKPEHYVRFIEPSKDDDSHVDYDMDEEDMAWLDDVNEERIKNGAPPVSEDDFETIMDRFEKESYFEINSNDNENGTLGINDDEAICCICMDGEGHPYNEIIFCEMCNLAVHQECYGVPYIPDGQWLCRRCLNSPSQAVDCILCPSNTGALKMAEGGFWSHILCAIWVPEVQFANPVFLEPVECLGKIPSSRWKLTCSLCNIKGVGACIQCNEKKCHAAFHPTCAQQAGFYMKFVGRPGEPKTKENHNVYCPLHRPKIEPGNDKFETFKQKMLNSVNSPVIFQPKVPPENIQAIGDRVNFRNKSHFVKKLLAYWILKRKCRFGVPLLRTNTYELRKTKVVPSSSSKKENDKCISESNYRQCFRLRQDMEKVRLLLELIRKRERLKLEFTKVNNKIIEYKLMPIIPYLRKLVQVLSSFDEEGIFEKPVDLKEVPNYLKVIKNPMDFSTISKKVDNYEYQSFEEFEFDFNVMIDNCLRFNRKNTFYYNAGIELRAKSRNILRNAREEFESPVRVKQEPIDEEELEDVPLDPQEDEPTTSRGLGSGGRQKYERKRSSSERTKRRNIRARLTNDKFSDLNPERPEVAVDIGRTIKVEDVPTINVPRPSTVRSGKEYAL